MKRKNIELLAEILIISLLFIVASSNYSKMHPSAETNENFQFLSLDGWNFYFVDTCLINEDCIAWTTENRNIYITQYSPDIERSCNHEVCHNLIVMEDAELEEQLCRNISDKLNYPVCNKLMEVLENE